MQAAVGAKLAGYGRWTYRGAWLLEIIAAIIGLATGLALGYQAFSASGQTDSTQLILASAPFFMVALAELTKIPVATLLFSAPWLWKPVVLVFMIVLAGITFETVFMGLERAATLRQLQYETLRQQIDTLRLKGDALEEQATEAAGRNSLDAAQAEIVRLQQNVASTRASFQEQIEAVERELEGARALSPEAARARDQLVAAKEELAALGVAQEAELSIAIEQFNSQRDSYVTRIAIYLENDDRVAADKAKADLDALTNPRPRLAAKHEAALAEVGQRIDSLQIQFDQLLAASAPMTEAQRVESERHRTQLITQRDEAMARWNEQLRVAQDRLAQAQVEEANKANTAAENQRAQDEISTQISRLEGERIPMAREDQIRRIAGRVFGKKAEDVTEDQADLIAIIWFGSLAGLAALAGPVSAMVALALQHIGAKATEPKRDGPFSRTLRRTLVNWRKKRVRTIAVPIEVTVEKEVEKRVEVPVEKLVKDIVYVPLFTDDPELVSQAVKAILPADVAEEVVQSAKRSRGASKARHVTP